MCVNILTVFCVDILSSPGHYICLLTQVKERERMERQISVQSIEPGPRDREYSALRTKPLPETQVHLPIAPYVLPAVGG